MEVVLVRVLNAQTLLYALVGWLLLADPASAQILADEVVRPRVVMHDGAIIARQLDPAPGTGGTFASFGLVRVGAAGHVAFDAVIAGSPFVRGVFLSSGGTTTVLAHTGQIAPGTVSTYTSFAVLAVSETGAVVYRAVVQSSPSVIGIFLASGGTQTALALQGQVAPGTGGLTFSSSLPSNWAGIQGAGSVAFMAFLSSGSGVFHYSGGTLTPVVLNGEATPAGGLYSTFAQRVFVDAADRVYFIANTTGGPAWGIFASDAGVETSMRVSGDATPIGGVYTTLTDFSANALGDLAFRAGVSGGSASSAIVYSAEGSDTVVAQGGESAPGTGGGVFSDLGTTSANASGQVLFDTTISGGAASWGVFLASEGDVQDVAIENAPVYELEYRYVSVNLRPTLDDSGAAAFGALILTTGDEDGDGIGGLFDNCLAIANPDQCDTDQDGYGNICDGDFDQSGVVNSGDFTQKFLPAFKSGIDTGVGTDMDCSGSVNANDFSSWFYPQFVGGKPGRSGLDCAGTVPCDL